LTRNIDSDGGILVKDEYQEMIRVLSSYMRKM